MTDPDQIRAHSIIKTVTAQEAFFVAESPVEVRGRLAEMRQNMSLGLVEDEGEQSGLLVLVGIDTYADPNTQKTKVEPFELSLHPGTIALIRGVSDHYWDTHLAMGDQVGQRAAAEAAPQGGGLGSFLQSMGFEVWPPQGGNPRHQGGGHGVKPALISQVQPTDKCCCDHTVAEHEVNGEFVGGCQACGCGVFHTHD